MYQAWVVTSLAFDEFNALSHSYLPISPPPKEMTFEQVGQEDNPLFGNGGGRGMMSTVSLNAINAEFFERVQSRLFTFGKANPQFSGTASTLNHSSGLRHLERYPRRCGRQRRATLLR